MGSDWVNIYESNKSYEVEIIKGMLLENEIEALIVNKQDSIYLFGEFELYVLQDNVIKAKSLIHNFNL
ncbi:MAG: DUF2007 domain-containing protein [Bacteroidales bacterium]|jgi:hypothetical protein|nr:DUF2007 domain-containing protein [Bacteroidales bacterium]MDD4214030.1 DUF2007 domain-containing protein [Bacteroidales bacterium]